MSILDQIFDEAEKTRLQAASNTVNKTAPIPNAALNAIQNRLGTSSFDNAQLAADLSMTAFDPSQEQIDMNLAGVSNQGIPARLRAKISIGGVTDPEVNKKNVLFNLCANYRSMMSGKAQGQSGPNRRDAHRDRRATNLSGLSHLQH